MKIQIYNAEDHEWLRLRFKFFEENSEFLRYYEAKLLASFEEQYKKNGRLSPKQITIIDDIYVRINGEMEND